MLAVLLAMINLSNADPQPLVPPPAQITQRVTGSLDVAAPLASTSAGEPGEVPVAPCILGARRLTPNLADDVMPASQTESTPQCFGPDAAFFDRQFLLDTAPMRRVISPEFGSPFTVGTTPGMSQGFVPLLPVPLRALNPGDQGLRLHH